MNASSEQDDDWMIQAMTRYENLFMFELPQPTRCIEWSQQGTAICVAGCSLDSSCEVTQLELPGKLLHTKDETHWAKRDFHMINGAFSSCPITTLKYLESSDVLASSGGQPSISLWKTNSLSPDCLEKTGEVSVHLPCSLQSKPPSTDCLTFIDAHSEHPNTILTGLSLSLSTVQTLDLSTGKCTFSLDGPDEYVHGLSYVTMATDLISTCSGVKGDIDIWDTRVNGGKQVTTVKTSKTAELLEKSSQQDGTLDSETENVSPGFDFTVSHDSGCKMALLSSSGHVQLYDSRQTKEPCASCQLGVVDTVKTWFRKTIGVPHIEFSPYNSNLLSLSGCATGIKVYDSSNWTLDTTGVTPVFSHTGHEDDSPTAQVLAHSWQPNAPSTILSSDSEGSLHAWQWKN